MTDKTLPVGSIVRMGDLMGIVAGIRFVEENNRLVKAYICAAYPIGFTGEEHLRVIPAEETEPVSGGYRSPAAEPFLTYMDNVDIAAHMADAKTVNGYLEEAYTKLFGGKS